jgi:hypothetical protein
MAGAEAGRLSHECAHTSRRAPTGPAGQAATLKRLLDGGLTAHLPQLAQISEAAARCARGLTSQGAGSARAWPFRLLPRG